MLKINFIPIALLFLLFSVSCKKEKLENTACVEVCFENSSPTVTKWVCQTGGLFTDNISEISIAPRATFCKDLFITEEGITNTGDFPNGVYTISFKSSAFSGCSGGGSPLYPKIHNIEIPHCGTYQVSL